jgi:predicted MFS family arabinose efflux permease
MGKTIPKGRRGRLLATRATGGGLLTLGAGLFLYFVVRTDSSITSILWMVGVACVLWFLAGFFFLLIKEQPGATEGGRTAIDEAKDGFQFLKENRQLRNFIISRALLMAIPLAQPFFIVFGKEVTNADFKGLGLMIIVSGIAGFISSPFWGKFADRSSKNMMRVVAVLGVLNILAVLSFPFLPEQYTSIYAFAPLILINMMIHGGARLSRKTWLTDFAPEKERPLYIATANTMIGLFTLVAAGIGFIAELLSIEALFVFLISMLLGSIYFTSTLKDV